MRSRSLALIVALLGALAGAAHAQTSPSCVQLPNVVCDVGSETISAGTKTVTGTFDFTGGTLILPNSTTAPACTGNGAIYVDSDAAQGARLKICIGGAFVNVDENGGGAAGDSIQVAGSPVDTTANFVNTGVVDFTLNGAATPDEISATIEANSLDSTHLANNAVASAELSVSAITASHIGPSDLANVLVWESACTSTVCNLTGALAPRLASTILVVHQGLTLRRMPSAPGIGEFQMTGAAQITFNASQGVSTGAASAFAYYEQ